MKKDESKSAVGDALKKDSYRWGTRLLIVGAIIAVMAVYYVPDGEVGVMFNKLGPNKGFDYLEKPQGLGLKIPFIQSVFNMPFRTQTISFCDGDGCDYSPLTPKDKNGINFITDITVRYALSNDQAAEFVEQKGRGKASMERILVTSARADSTRGVFGQYAQEDVPSNRIEIATQILEKLQERVDLEASGKLKDGFIIIEAVDVRDVDYNERINDRIIQKQTRLQEAQEMEYNIEIANKTREMELINADRDKRAMILRAEGDAEAILVVATAKAEGTQKINDAYQGMPIEYVMTKYAEAIKPTDKIYLGFESLSGMLPIMDMNQLMGVLKNTERIGPTTTQGAGGSDE